MTSALLYGNGGNCGVVAHHVLNHFIKDFRLYRFLHKVASAFLQGGHDVLLVSHRGDHHDASIRMGPHDALRGFNAFHLRHGDVHEHHVGRSAVKFGNGGAAITGFADDLAAECLDHLRNVFARENRVIHHQVAYWPAVFPKQYWKLVHNNSLLTTPTKLPG